MQVSRALWWTLRIGAAFCFIGHGAFGIITKAAWVPFFGLVGIDSATAFTLMPVIGLVDIGVGLSVLISPRPAALLYMVVWTLWTAALRPLTGDSVFEMLERAGNYGVPFAMLLMCLPREGWRAWLAPASPRPLTAELQRTLRVTLAAVTALLVLGHGALGIRGTASLTSHYSSVGISSGAVASTSAIVGWFEIALVLLLIVRPSATTALAIVGWKLATESLWLVSGAPVWEFIERAGGYAAPLALALVAGATSRRAGSTRLPLFGRAAAILLLSVAASVPAAALAQARDDRPWQERIGALDDRSLLAALRSGGLVLACRHAITSNGEDKSETDRALQRNLSEEGRQQAMAIGRAVRAARVGICPVISSPIYRARETAGLAFGDTAIVVTRLLRGEHPRRDVMRLFLEAPPEGQNKVLMTHQGTLYRVFTMFRRPEIAEGDCVVLRPNAAAGTFEVVGKLGLEDWQRLANLR